MLVDPKDGACRSCGGQLDITAFDDCSMTVICTECCDSYDVETDAFGDGCVTYYFNLHIEKLEEGEGS